MPEQISRPLNQQWKVVRVWSLLSILFLAACFVPGLAGIDGMEGGFAMITVFGFLVVCGLVVIAVYTHRARQLDKMINNDRNLARWEIEKSLWLQFVELDFTEDRAISKGTFILITVISIVIGILLSLLFKDILMLYICLGIIVMLIIPGFTFPFFRKRRKLRNPPLVIISQNSVYVGGSYFNWDILGACLNKVQLDTSGQPVILRFNMSYPARTGIEKYEIRVPVPSGKVEEALRLQEYLGY